MNSPSTRSPRQFLHPFAFVFALIACNDADAARELSTDRPDATESPFTVEPGRLQVELSFASFIDDRHNTERDATHTKILNIAPVNLRIGLSPSWEIQIVLDGFLDVKTGNRPLGFRMRHRGFGDTTLRMKHNFWGNDAGESAFGVMSFVKLPTHSGRFGERFAEGGILFPYAGKLSEDTSFGTMVELDVVRNSGDDGYDLIAVGTMTVGRDLTGAMGGFVELALETGVGKPSLGFNTGLTLAVNDNCQLDAGLSVGITRAAPDLGVFFGISQRF